MMLVCPAALGVGELCGNAKSSSSRAKTSVRWPLSEIFVALGQAEAPTASPFGCPAYRKGLSRDLKCDC